MGGSAGTDAGGCDRTRAPEAAACVVDEAYGVFVSASAGNDATGSGTKAAPFATIGKALGEAKAAGKRVYVCADGGSYAESVSVNAALDGLEVFGGFRCGDWSYDVALRAKVAPASAIAMQVEQLSAGLRVENLEIVAAEAAAGASSFGAIVFNSQNVVFRRMKLGGGKGGDGEPGHDGEAGANGEEPGADQAGKPAVCSLPGGTAAEQGGFWTAPSACGSRGGAGGDANQNAAGQAGDPGMPVTNVTPTNNSNGGRGGGLTTEIAQPGSPGSNGDTGPNGGAAPVRGAFTSAGFTPAHGNDGTNGFPGQGGGGGGGSAATGLVACMGATGGAGGMGGCGGTKATGGRGGGASVALLSWSSGVTLDACELIGGTGGAGGKGGDGGGGGSGGPGARGGEALAGMGPGARGGDGGFGGPGGSGSGGTGGPSYALVHRGDAPIEIGANVFRPGSAGAAGKGGSLQPTGANPAPDGSAGESVAKLAQPP